MNRQNAPKKIEHPVLNKHKKISDLNDKNEWISTNFSPSYSMEDWYVKTTLELKCDIYNYEVYFLMRTFKENLELSLPLEDGKGMRPVSSTALRELRELYIFFIQQREYIFLDIDIKDYHNPKYISICERVSGAKIASMYQNDNEIVIRGVKTYSNPFSQFFKNNEYVK